MTKKMRLGLVGVFLLTCFGISLAWYKAMTSPDVQLAKSYLLSTETISQKYRPVTNLVLVGFRISLSDHSLSYCTFLAKTPVGRKLFQVKVDKKNETLTLYDVNEE